MKTLLKLLPKLGQFVITLQRNPVGAAALIALCVIVFPHLPKIGG